MKMFRWIIFVVLIALTGCGQNQTVPSTITLVPTVTPTLSQPLEKTTSVPDPEAAVRAYIGAWKVDDYTTMYNALMTYCYSVAYMAGAVTRFNM